ncbi:MAG: hypothetical protein ACI9LY_001435 [Arenicella sp.]|jgi:hypothetical protein
MKVIHCLGLFSIYCNRLNFIFYKNNTLFSAWHVQLAVEKKLTSQHVFEEIDREVILIFVKYCKKGFFKASHYSVSCYRFFGSLFPIENGWHDLEE